jgi:hypothetical protein
LLFEVHLSQWELRANLGQKKVECHTPELLSPQKKGLCPKKCPWLNEELMGHFYDGDLGRYLVLVTE